MNIFSGCPDPGFILRENCFLRESSGFRFVFCGGVGYIISNIIFINKPDNSKRWI